MPFKIDTTTILYIVLVMGGAISLILGAPLAAQAILGSHRRSASSFTDMGSSYYDTHIPDHSTHTDSHTSRSTISGILNQIQTIISTIVATVALAYIFPDSILLCNLD
ncbi:hypothetical protein F1880_008437 [Penicillium rolfsii]|nr:hypothetical protein F1880_008437 [Penicillium rolfsii]